MIWTYVVGTQKNRLNETVLLITQNKCLNCWVRKYLQYYSQNFGLSLYDFIFYFLVWMPENKHYIVQIAMLISVFICLTNTKENF